MKNTGLLIAFLLGCFSLNSQVTITSATFPKAGDNLKYATLTSPGFDLDLKTTAGPHEWDFSVLNRGIKYEEVYLNPALGNDAATFPEANLLMKRDGEETYISANDTKLQALGLGGVNPLFGAPIAIRYTDRPSLRQAPLSFVNSIKSQSKFRIALPASIFPDSLLAIIPANFKPDSIRIDFNAASSGLLDAYGTLKMQGQTFNVLREKSEVESSTDIFIKVPILGWVNLQSLGGLIDLPEFISRLIGKRETIVYRFHSNDKKEILVTATYNLDNVLTQVEFADLGQVSGTDNTLVKSINFYPNPANDILHIQTGALPEGSYLITLSDINGKAVYAEPCFIHKGLVKTIDVSSFTSGTYFLTFQSPEIQKAITSKIMIAR